MLQIAISLSPSIFVDDIGQRDTADWPEPAHRIPDWQDGIGMRAGRQAECGLRFLLERMAALIIFFTAKTPCAEGSQMPPRIDYSPTGREIRGYKPF